jgi:hypothetical protein
MAAALGISKSQVARDAARGMPMNSAGEAKSWRVAYLESARPADQAAPLGQRAGEPRAPSDLRLMLAEIDRMQRRAQAGFALHGEAFRASLCQVQDQRQRRLRLARAAFELLVGHECLRLLASWAAGAPGDAADIDSPAPDWVSLAADLAGEISADLASGRYSVALTNGASAAVVQAPAPGLAD